MIKRADPVDQYIERSADFARPVLRKIRALFHKADPRINESIKWGFPHFECKGIVGSMAAFKHSVSLGFWKGGLIKDKAGIFPGAGSARLSMLKMTSVADIPRESLLLAYIREAVKLNEQGVKIPAKPRIAKRLVVPRFFLIALKNNKKAYSVFESFSASHKREYVEWLMEAKREETRERRLESAIEWIAEGKPRNWKYMK